MSCGASEMCAGLPGASLSRRSASETICLNKGDVSAHFKFHTSDNSGTDSSFCRLSIKRDVSFGTDFRQLVRKYIECFEAHAHSGRYIATVVLVLCIDEIVCDTCSGVNTSISYWFHHVAATTAASLSIPSV